MLMYVSIVIYGLRLVIVALQELPNCLHVIIIRDVQCRFLPLHQVSLLHLAFEIAKCIVCGCLYFFETANVLPEDVNCTNVYCECICVY